MNSLAFVVGLKIILAIGTFCVFATVFGLLAPKEKKADVVDVAVKRFKSTSSFARLQPEEKFIP